VAQSLRILGVVLRPVPWSSLLALMLGVMAAASGWLGLEGREWLVTASELSPEALIVLEESHLHASFPGLEAMARIIGVLLVLLIPLTLLKRRVSVFLFRVGGAAFTVVWCYLLHFLLDAPDTIFATSQKILDKGSRNDLWTQSFVAWFPFLLVPILFLVASATRSLLTHYRAPEGGPLPLGDRICENLRTHGHQPRWRTSGYWALTLHLLIIVGPVLIRGCGWMKPYEIPKGVQNPIVEIVVKKKPKPKPKKKLVVALDSPFIFERPDIDDSKVIEEVDKVTERQYKASEMKARKGKAGKPGWPHGMENARVRFIRLKYGGGDWDQDMGKGADYNFLIQFSRLTSFKIWDSTEAIEIYQLGKFPEHKAPPFVFITGKRGISVSGSDVKTLRKYCLDEGGMIFADNGGGHFNSSFRSLMRRVFPGKQWVDISSDDVLFQHPYSFPSGAPPLWAHSGRRAMGLKDNGRWIVFYHQGDMNDAWKTGHSGASEAVAAQSYKLGVNIINYAFTQYLDRHYGE
jgi:hypothetical protein